MRNTEKKVKILDTFVTLVCHVCKIFIFGYFQKIPSEINSTHPFHPNLIPNTSYVKIFILFVGGSQNSKKKFYI